MFQTLKNAWKIPDLRAKILYTLGMLIIFRIGAAIPVPGINPDALANIFSDGNQLAGFFDLMSGGSFKSFTLFAIGITPYITASIIINLLQIAFPAFAELSKEGEEGRKKVVQYTRYGTVVLALIQSFGFSMGIFRNAFVNGGTAFEIFVAIMALTAGTSFLMYLGEKITENGIGNGISLFIFAGIISRLPSDLVGVVANVKAGSIQIVNLVMFGVVAIVIIAGIVYIQQGTRKIPVQYAKRMVGRKMYGGQSTHIPLKVNQAGVIPIIFAMSLLMMPMTIGMMMPNSGYNQFIQTYFSHSSVLYNVLYAVLIVFFTYFYTFVSFNVQDVSDQMKKNGGFIPGIRPGKPTTEYLTRTLNRITLAGAVFLAAIAILPNVLMVAFGGMKFDFGGTSLLIAVGVALETMKQIEAQMVMRHYQGFLK